MAEKKKTTRTMFDFFTVPEAKKHKANNAYIYVLIDHGLSNMHTPGLSTETFRWMDQEAIRMNIPESGRIEGILLDEMSIQQKLEIQRCGKSIEMVGFVDMGQESANLSALRTAIFVSRKCPTAASPTPTPPGSRAFLEYSISLMSLRLYPGLDQLVFLIFPASTYRM
ncbi:hypothetical protein MAR_035211 [Mya arenaria]|uniref:Transposable element P transposase-like RNase H domain-containing protein n=1 Tax=Mya arenaria TaxID=6604 RepID=A0ABY7ELQ0_MYAAR|nr:hypothetical protein MAR_035211 [Mya arenaria]